MSRAFFSGGESRGKPWLGFRLLAVVGALALHGFSVLFAQSHSIRVYTEADGLPSSSVYDVVEAPDGRMWFATRSGICVYDGAEWRIFGLEDGLLPTGFLRLAVEENGKVWALNNSHIQVFEQREDGWFGLPRFNDRTWNWQDAADFALVKSGGISRPAVGTRFGLYVWNGEAWRHLEIGPVRSLASAGSVLFIAADDGLLRMDDIAAEPTGVDLPFSPVSGLALDTAPMSQKEPGKPVLWVSSGRALGRWDGQGGFIPVTEDLPRLGDEIGEVRLEADGRGGVYVADRETLFHVEADGSATYFDQLSGFAAPGATSILRGAGDILWVASERGVGKLVSRRFANYRKADGLLESEVSAIIENRPGELIFGHNFGLTRLVDGVPEQTRRFNLTVELPVSDTRVMDLVKRGDDLWAVTSRTGLWRLVGGDLGKMERFSDPGGALPQPLSSAVVDDQNRLWVAGIGLARLDFVPGRVAGSEGSDPAGSLVANIERLEFPGGETLIRRLAFSGGRLYAATVNRGLWIYDGARWSVATRSDGTAPSLYTVAPWGSDIWVGANEGLFRLRAGRLVPAAEPAIHRAVYSLLEGPRGRLWVGTDFGVQRLDGSSVRRLGLREGLAGQEANRDGLAYDHRGAIWIGTALGASRYDERLDREHGPPLPHLEGVEVGGRLESLDEPLSLPWRRNQLTFHFSAISFVDEDDVQFSGRLVGFDEAFQPSARALGRRMHYTNLPPGEYRFEIRARRGHGRSGGEWSEVVSSDSVHIGRPFWLTPLFFVALAGLLFLLAVAVIRHLAARRRGRELEVLVGERTRELVVANRRLVEEVEEHQQTEARLRGAKKDAEEASLAKSRFLAVMSHELRTPMAGVLGLVDLLERAPLEKTASSHVRDLRKSGEALLVILDDILAYSGFGADGGGESAESFDVLKVLEDVVAFFGPQVKKKGLVLSLKRDAALPRWLMGHAAQVRQILIKLTCNAVKFTERGEVEIEARWRGGVSSALTMIVRDTGIGIADEERLGLFDPFHQVDSSAGRRFGGTGLGLAICKRLVESIGGEIDLSSREGYGSTFTVTVPMVPCADVASEQGASKARDGSPSTPPT